MNKLISKCCGVEFERNVVTGEYVCSLCLKNCELTTTEWVEPKDQSTGEKPMPNSCPSVVCTCPHCSSPSNKEPKEQWETILCRLLTDHIFMMDCLECGQCERWGIVRTFVQQLLSSKDTEWAEKVKRVKDRFRCGNCDGAKNLYHTHCCQALSELLKSLK